MSVWDEPPGQHGGSACSRSTLHPGGVWQAKACQLYLSVFKGKVWDREGSLQLHVPLANVMTQQENPSFLLFCQF